MDGSGAGPGTLSIAELEAILLANGTNQKGNSINKVTGKLLQQQQQQQQQQLPYNNINNNPTNQATGNAGAVASLSSRPISRRASGVDGTLMNATKDGQKEKELPIAAAAAMNSSSTRADQAEFELKRMTEQLKLARLQASELSERVILIQSERDFYAHKWAHACPMEAGDDSPPLHLLCFMVSTP